MTIGTTIEQVKCRKQQKILNSNQSTNIALSLRFITRGNYLLHFEWPRQCVFRWRASIVLEIERRFCSVLSQIDRVKAEYLITSKKYVPGRRGETKKKNPRHNREKNVNNFFHITNNGMIYYKYTPWHSKCKYTVVCQFRS